MTAREGITLHYYVEFSLKFEDELQTIDLKHKSSVQEYQWSHKNGSTLVPGCGRKACYNGVN